MVNCYPQNNDTTKLFQSVRAFILVESNLHQTQGIRTHNAEIPSLCLITDITNGNTNARGKDVRGRGHDLRFHRSVSQVCNHCGQSVRQGVCRYGTTPPEQHHPEGKSVMSGQEDSKWTYMKYVFRSFAAAITSLQRKV